MISVRNLSKSHQLGTNIVRAVRGLSCDIPAGRMTFIVGPSGSGKSSLMYLLGGLDQPDSGEILIAGRDLVRMTPAERDAFRRERVGFVFQNFNLLGNLSAVDNVLVPHLPRGITSAQRTEAARLLAQLGLGNRLDHKPHQLSGGEQQRVAIARALLKRPVLLLADEPTGELDSETGAEIYSLLRQMQQQFGTTVVIVTHERGYIAPEDHLLALRDGQLDKTS
jgi:putative ABC transport system ATP-binding protein